jgi:hypothetical protein
MQTESGQTAIVQLKAEAHIHISRTPQKNVVPVKALFIAQYRDSDTSA